MPVTNFLQHLCFPWFHFAVKYGEKFAISWLKMLYYISLSLGFENIFIFVYLYIYIYDRHIHPNINIREIIWLGD